MTLTYDETALILALLDNAPGRDLEVRADDLHLSVQAWPEAYEAPATSPESRCASFSQMPSAPDAVRVYPSSDFAVSPALGICTGINCSAGEYVNAGQTLVSIEGAGGEHAACTAPAAGWVREIDVRKGAFIEFGQVLIVIERDCGASAAPAGLGEIHDTQTY